MLSRKEPVDSLQRDGELLLLFDHELVRLNPIGAAAFAIAEAPISLADLAQRLTAVFGEPPDGTAEQSTARIVAELVAQGVLFEEGQTS